MVSVTPLRTGHLATNAARYIYVHMYTAPDANIHTCIHAFIHTCTVFCQPQHAMGGGLMLSHYVMATRTHTRAHTHTDHTLKHTQTTHTNMLQDPEFVKKHNMTLDLEYYLNNQLKNSVISLLEPIYPRSEV